MKVLIVDDDPVHRAVVTAMIRAAGHECLVASDGLAAFALLHEVKIDVLVTDREMPGIDGLELCRLVRSQPSTEHVYIILITGLGSPEQARQGMLAGADDYLVKPSKLVDVQLRLIAAERVAGLHRRIELATQELRAVARRDPLTQLGNRRSLSEDLAVMTDRLHRYGQRFSIALLDVDHFKLYNDTLGHQAGDEALKAVANVLIATSRTGDTCYRYGGEEFLCIFPEQSPTSVLAAVGRIVEGVARLAIPHSGSAAAPFLTVSVGVAEMAVEHLDADEAVQAADAALYRAKKKGRNRVELAPPYTRQGAAAGSGATRRVAGDGMRGPSAASGPGRPIPTTAPATTSPATTSSDASEATGAGVDLSVLDALLDRFDDKDGELREDLLMSYLENGPAHLRSLVRAAGHGDAAEVAATAQTLRSSSALLGATVLAGLCQRADDLARSGSADLTEIVDLIRTEYAHVADVMTELARPAVVLPRPRRDAATVDR